MLRTMPELTRFTFLMHITMVIRYSVSFFDGSVTFDLESSAPDISRIKAMLPLEKGCSVSYHRDTEAQTHTVPLNTSCRMTKPTKWPLCLAKTQINLGIPQSDQSLRSELSGELRIQAFFMQTEKILIRQGGCPGWPESLLKAQVILLVLSCGSSYHRRGKRAWTHKDMNPWPFTYNASKLPTEVVRHKHPHPHLHNTPSKFIVFHDRPVRRLLKRGASSRVFKKWGVNLKKILILRPKLGV